MAYSRDSFEYRIDCVADHGQVAGQIHTSRTRDVPGHYIGTYRKHPFYYSVYMQDLRNTDEKKCGTHKREQSGDTTFQPECPVCLDETGQPIPISGFEGPLCSDEVFSNEQRVYHLESDSADTADKHTTKLLVTNLPSLLPTAQYKEFLEMFFEYKRKENEHVVVSVDLDEENSMAMVEIEDSKSADVLLQKRPISMLGTVIGVDVYIPEPLCTIEVRGPADILVRIILQLYFENTKKSNGDEIEKIEIIENEDEKVAYITFETEEVARKVVSKDQHTIDKKLLLVELYTPKPKVPKKQSNTKSRELENHDTTVNKEHIINKQGDNDGVVAVVGVETGEDLFIDNVLKQPHTIDGQQIDVNLNRLRVTQGDGSGPKLQIPDHIVISGIELQKLKFMLNSTVNKEAIEKQIAGCHAKIIWPEHPKSGNVTIECTLTADIKDCRKLATTWKQSVEENFHGFMKNIVVSQMRVISDVWNKVMEGLQNMTIASPDAVDVLVNKDEGAVTVVGLKHAIGKVSGDISKIIKDVEDEAERDKQRVKETVTSIELVKTKMLLAAKYPTKMEDKYENMKVKINQNKNEILFEGLLSDVRGAKVDMYEMIQGFSHETIDNIPETCAGLYQTKQVKEYIMKALKQNHLTAIWEVTGRQLVIYSISDDRVKRCSEIVWGAVVEKTIGLNKNSRLLINTELWQGKIGELHAQYTGRAYISVPQELAKVHVCTTDDIALEIMNAMKKFLRLNTICEESVQFTRSITKLIETHHKDELHQISKDLTSAHVQIIAGHQSAEFRVRGTKEGMKLAKIKLQALADRVIKRDKSFDKPGIGVHMQSTKGKDTINVVESAHPCVIEIKGDGSDDEATEDLYDTIPEDGKPPSQGRSTIHASCKAYDDRKIYTTEGDMTELTVDVLVNTADEKLSFNGGLGKVIVSKGGEAISKACSDYIQRSGKLSDGETFLSPAGRLKSKFIIHVVAPVWKGGDNKEEDQLTEAVFRAMMQASRKNLKSIALPAISCGVYSFPVKRATAVIVAAVKNFFREEQESSLREVYLCDVKGNTVSAFTDALFGEFGRSAVTVYPQTRPVPSPRYKADTSASMPIRPISTSDENSDSDTGPYTKKKIPPGATKEQDSYVGSGGDSENIYDDSNQDGCIFGNLKVSVKQGDITTEVVDCIVNSTNEKLDLTQGAVSKALLRKGGPALKKDAKSKQGEMKKCGLAMTYAPGLVTKRIIHVVAKESVKDWKRIIFKCLEKAEIENMTSLAFPALGTGLQMQASELAKAMISSIMDFQSSQPTCLKEVRIVIFQSQMVEEFNKAIEQASGAKPKGGFFETIQKGFQAAFGAPAVPPRKQAGQRKSYHRSVDKNQVTFTIYAMKESTIQSAIAHLKSTLDKMFYSRDFKNTVISRLTDKQRKDVEKIAEQNYLQLKWGSKEDEEGLVISGIMKKVNYAREEIYEIIRVADKRENEKREAEIMNNVVQWHFIEITELKQELMPYDPTLNLRIEKAYNNKDKCYEFNDKQGNCYVVNFTTMEEYTKGNKADAVTVIRRDKIKEGPTFEAPVTWTDMKGNLKVVTLQPTDKEFQDIAAKFAQSSRGNFTVSKIDRIQNKTLFQQYQAKKELLDSQNPPCHQNEHFLWYGTAVDSKESINAHGFNRSYCCKNATAFGDGVYFAVQASYSCQQQYSRPDANGIKRIYYCRVLTGEFTLGKQGMRVPPAKKSGGSHALYDSVVNNVQSPAVFIIFHDTQGYPDYLLEFK